MQILFTYHKKNIISKMIMAITDCNFSHAAIRFGRDEDNWMVESNSKGVNPAWYNTFTKTNGIIHSFEFTGLDEIKLEKYVDECLNDMMGKSYDFLGMIGFGIALIAKKLGFKKVKNVFGSGKMYFCSELVMRIGLKVQAELGIELFKGDPELTSPYDLFLQCVNSKYFIDKSLEYKV